MAARVDGDPIKVKNLHPLAIEFANLPFEMLG